VKTGGWEEHNKEEEVIGGWRQLHNEYLHNLSDAQNIVCLIQSQRLSKMVRSTDKWEISEIHTIP
jgi:hypothetical protein